MLGHLHLLYSSPIPRSGGLPVSPEGFLGSRDRDDIRGVQLAGRGKQRVETEGACDGAAGAAGGENIRAVRLDTLRKWGERRGACDEARESMDAHVSIIPK
jgi:hypothetical protein